MTRIKEVDDSIDPEGFTLVEGFPGTGLVAKISADYIKDHLDMDLYAEVYSEEIPSISVFEQGSRNLKPAVCIYADPENELLVLKCDAPVSAKADGFISGLTDWIDGNNITPIYQLGIPSRSDEKKVFGVSIGDAEKELDAAEVPKPETVGGISGPTGAVLERSQEEEISSIGLTVSCAEQLPDPEAARTLIEEAIEPITGIDLDTQQLAETAEQIKEQKKKLAEKMQQAQRDETSQAYPEELYK
ncbi:proteasome assembly chaperone family protein [Candidatus Nanohaloarchaea archaeon]|nr:proteasome assembly chaperone family protein [Candidatus Nanohaloarchaea archaeon]